MLAKEFRITKKKDFDAFFGVAFKKVSGKSASTKNLILKIRPNELKQSRFAFVISTKIDKRAVVRNKIKRQLRAIVKKYLDKFPAGKDFLFITQKPIAKLDFEQIEKDVLFLLSSRA